eukprot:gnl/Spiro4/3020_TR1487_c0_g6_i1.p1 gnl/Spiro4/3020_TR1487_c0_g6~~gnl/Spiro4/3020_TR1487_c0_g6_i1.p1  ORF type:complete len:297 (-),score=66.08 gnl/Spiro4/3020_TR1487_c0_g6_i1:86-976(-)
MGGGGWDGRTVTAAAAGAAYSAAADETLSRNNTLAESVRPMNKIIRSEARAHIVVALDVSGSMSDWPKVIWDKLPMFYGQLTMPETNYLPGVALSFCFFADYFDSNTTLQITDFCQGSMIDGEISVFCLGGGSGPGDGEGYDLPAYFYGNPERCRITSPKENNYFFMIGDEKHYPNCEPNYVQQFIGDTIPAPIPMKNLFDRLRERFQCYYIMKPLSMGGTWEADRDAMWLNTMGGPEYMAMLTNPKAVVDMMLGIVATKSHTRDAAGYIRDLQTRGQSQERQDEIMAAFRGMRIA